MKHSAIYSYLRQYMDVLGQIYAPAVLSPEKIPEYPQHGRICGPQFWPGLIDSRKILAHFWNFTPVMKPIVVYYKLYVFITLKIPNNSLTLLYNTFEKLFKKDTFRMLCERRLQRQYCCTAVSNCTQQQSRTLRPSQHHRGYNHRYLLIITRNT